MAVPAGFSIRFARVRSSPQRFDSVLSIEQFEQPVSAAKLRMAATIAGCEVVDRSLAA
jgi:hypothetical protein